jgi:mannose-6-phosphate isomerase-like protein (cupin superfamily)
LTTVALSENFSLFSGPFLAQNGWRTQRLAREVGESPGRIRLDHHDHEDEMFLVVKGCLFMGLQGADGTEREIAIHLESSSLLQGVEHKPRADEETQIVLLEPKTTTNTGNVRGERTVEDLQRI